MKSAKYIESMKGHEKMKRACWDGLLAYLCDAIRYADEEMLNTEDGEDGDTPILCNAVVDTWEGSNIRR